MPATQEDGELLRTLPRPSDADLQAWEIPGSVCRHLRHWRADFRMRKALGSHANLHLMHLYSSSPS